MVVHEVAESLGWHQETVNVPVSKGKGKGKRGKGKGKGKDGKGRIPRQVTVTHKPSARPKPDWSKEVETELERMILDPSLQECPFPWSEQHCQEGERKRRAVRDVACPREVFVFSFGSLQGSLHSRHDRNDTHTESKPLKPVSLRCCRAQVVTRFPVLLAKDEREGSKLRVVVRRAEVLESLQELSTASLMNVEVVVWVHRVSGRFELLSSCRKNLPTIPETCEPQSASGSRREPQAPASRSSESALPNDRIDCAFGASANVHLRIYAGSGLEARVWTWSFTEACTWYDNSLMSS